MAAFRMLLPFVPDNRVCEGRRVRAVAEHRLAVPQGVLRQLARERGPRAERMHAVRRKTAMDSKSRETM